MSQQLCLRWAERRSRYAHPTAVIDPRQYDVTKLDRNPAKAFVAQHHYQGSFSADRRRFGLYRHGCLVGAAVFAHPTHGSTPVLSRFVLLDEVPGNGETWFLARCFAELGREPAEEGFSVVDSFSDPVPRTTLEGRLVMPGHVGTIYQAFNGQCVGRSKPDTVWLLPDGRALQRRSTAKLSGLVHQREKTWESAASTLISIGAAPLRDDEDGAAWLRRWRAKLCRPLKHSGNWHYVWALTRPARRRVAQLPDLDYPKKEAA